MTDFLAARGTMHAFRPIPWLLGGLEEMLFEFVVNCTGSPAGEKTA